MVSDGLRIALRRGRLVVGGANDRALAFPDARPVLQLLHTFCAPAETHEAGRAAGMHPEDARALVELLRDVEVLVPADPARSRSTAIEALLDVRELLADPPRPAADVDHGNACQRAVLEIARVLITASGEVPPAAPAERVNVGCGHGAIAGWLNIDREAPADVICDVRRGLPVADGSASFVYLAHVLEHLEVHEADDLLAEVRRILRPGGVARIAVPDARAWLEAYCRSDDEFWAQAGDLLAARWADPAERLPELLGYLGAASGGRAGGHRAGYDFETLRHRLQFAGFAAVRRCGYQQSRQPELRVDDSSRAARMRVRGRCMSLFVEATTPHPAT